MKRRGKREEEKKRRGVAVGARLLVGCCLVVFRSTCMCCGNAPPRPPPSRAITITITHPPFASFSCAAPHSPPTSLGAAARALRLSPGLSFFLFQGAAFLKFWLAFPLLFCTHQDQQHGGTGESGDAGPVGAVGAAGTGCSVVCPTTTVVAWPLAPNWGTGSGVGVASPLKSSRACLRVACLGIHPPACPEDGALSIVKVTHSPLCSP